MAFVINKIGPLYSGLLGGAQDALGFKPSNWINNAVGPLSDILFGKSEPANSGVNLKVDSLAYVLKGEERNAVVLEEYTPPPANGTSAFKYNKNKGLLNQDFSNLGGGRFFVFIEYRDDQQVLRGMKGQGNMILSTRGPVKFNGQQNLPDVQMPGAGSVVMDMGPADSYINFEGSFLFQNPDESIAWLENARLQGIPFIFHYKRWHRFARIQRLSFDIINDNHIDFAIGLKVMGFDDKDLNNVISSGKKKTRLERLAVAEMASRVTVAAADAVAGFVGLNDLGDVVIDYMDQWKRVGSFQVAASEGFVNSSYVFSDFATARSGEINASNIMGNMAADTKKYVSSAAETNKMLNDAAEIAKGLL